MTRTKTLDASVLKAIKSGKFKNHYLVYNRKSTDEPDNQKNSITYQRAENTRFAKRQHLPIANVTMTGLCTNGLISEKHSGFKESDDLEVLDSGEVRYRIERPKFSQLVQFLNRGYFRGVLCLCWDRISRNQGDDTIIRKLKRRGVEFHFAFVTYDDSSSGELHMDIDGMFAQHHSRVTSEKIKTTIRNQRAEGKCTYRAPIGYLNTGSWDHKPHDPVRAPIIAELFELYASGHWSLSDLARHAQKQGLTSVPTRKRRTKEEMLADEEDDTDPPKISRPLTVARISGILNNPFYTGKVLGPDGKYVPSTSHEPLVTQDVFAQVQTHLKRKKVSTHYIKKLDYPFRGFIRCALCNRCYTPYEKKGHLYYNARCAPGCTNTLRNCSFNIMATQVAGLLRGLAFSKQEIVQIEANMETGVALLEEKRLKEVEQLERARRRVREDLAYLRTNQISLLRNGTFTPAELTEERDRLEAELDEFQDKEQISETAMRDLMKDVIRLSELLNTASTLFELANPHEKEKIAKLVFSELQMSENTLEFNLQTGLEPFENRILAFSAPNRWLSELYGCRDAIKAQTVTLLLRVHCCALSFGDPTLHRGRTPVPFKYSNRDDQPDVV